MKRTLKFSPLLLIILLLNFSCSKDDDIQINLKDLKVTVDENPANGQVLGQVQTDNNSSLSFSITTQTPAGALAIEKKTGKLTVADAILFDFETNPTITATVSAEGAQNTAKITINLNNLKELTTEDFSVTIDENPINGDTIGIVQATSDGTVSYSLLSQTPEGALNINTSTGELTVADATLFDFEVNPVITAIISVDNSGNTQNVTATINLTDVNEVSLQDFTTTIDENPVNGQSLGVVQVTGGEALIFNITSQTPNGALSINANTGELTVVDATLFDFEINPVITATISVDNSGSMQHLTATINLTNINEVSIQDFTATIDENPANGQSLGIVQATGDGTLSFSITSQTPGGALSINASTGELTVADATLFDYETNPAITATVTVDNAGNTESADVTINLTNVNELSIQQFNTTIDENSTNGSVLGTVQTNGIGILSFSIASQTPAGALSINASTGELTIADATLFDFETNPTITANISVSNSEGIETAIATVNLNDVNEIGEFKYGGVIFWLDPSDISHGLVCTVSDFPIIGGWGCQGTNIAGAIGTEIGQGQANTTAILAECATAGIAADIASNSTSGGYSDWFLPSKDALQEMHTHRATINNTAVLNGGSNLASGVFYWSSSQNDSNTAWLIYFDNNGAAFFLNKGTAGSNIKMRAVRAF
ncbi:hypothetical protein ACFSTE_04320 [Aquimarina hainanensis]|uniref:Cadherin domain-containing protein n=1 Tax=Aquimarina hainanensis TaxID=1578017 RepID=A0ABW5N3F1_9FLAO